MLHETKSRHFIVPNSQFHLIQGSKSLSTYSFNTGKAKHTFCSICGVQSFYTPRSNLDGYGNFLLFIYLHIIYVFILGVMPHCIFDKTFDGSKVQHFDGKNWEQEIQAKNHFIQYSKNQKFKGKMLEETRLKIFFSL